MIRRFWVAILLCAAGSSTVAAQGTPIFLRPPSANAAIRDGTALGAVADYPVTPDVRAIAENALLEKPTPLMFALPRGKVLKFDERRFEPIEGFNVTAEGDVVIDPSATDADLSFNWYGVGRGIELSFTVHQGRMTGSLSGMLDRKNEAWNIIQSRGQRVLRELDMSKFPGSLEDIPGPGQKSVATPLSATDAKLLVDGGGFVDILVVHTDNAIAQAGGQAALDELVLGSVADMQVALENSLAYRVRVRNVMPNGSPSIRVGYGESPGTTSVTTRWYAHRTWARTNAEVTVARNMFNADLVVLMVGDSGVCGVAYSQRPNCGVASNEAGCGGGPAYNAFAASVVSSRCALPTRTLAHEVGHQFGMEHDPPNGSAVGAASFPWSFGHTVSNGTVQARSIMAYQTTAACPLGCPIQLHYSNPLVDFQAFPGTPSGTAAADAAGRTRFNARTAVIYAPDMADFRGPRIAAFNIFGHGFEPLPGIFCNRNIWPNCPR